MKQLYKRMNERIKPDSGLPAQVMEQASSGKRRAGFRPVIAAAAMLALILAATPVLAEHIPWILERIAPELAEEYVPVELRDTDNGITMEVTAASIHDSKAELVVKIEGDALADAVGVAPILETDSSWHTGTAITALLDYEGGERDRADGIYYYQVTMTYRDGTPLREILDGEMTLMLNDVRISGFTSEEYVDIPIILTDNAQVTVERARAMEDYGFCSFGTGCSEGYEYYEDLKQYVLMTPGESVYDVTDKLSLTGAAYIDGKLHIQFAARDMNGGEPTWGHSSPRLQDSQGNQVTSIYRNLFAVNEDGHRVDYEECVYDIPPEELKNYTIVLRLEYRERITTRCQVTFHFSEDDIVSE